MSIETETMAAAGTMSETKMMNRESDRRMQMKRHIRSPQRAPLDPFRSFGMGVWFAACIAVVCFVTADRSAAQQGTGIVESQVTGQKRPVVPAPADVAGPS